ncbi:MAG: copper-binding protein [Acidobacteria bacterium]|nr:copper-binding protein [Acidobacteriota bacterium]
MQKLLLVLSPLVLLLTAACASSKPAAPAKEYHLTGEVMRIDAQVRSATIKHEKIEGWMEAMTMEFPVHDAKEFEKLAPGKKITATVYVSGDEFWIGNIQVTP